MSTRPTPSGVAMAVAVVIGLCGSDSARAQPTEADSSSAQPQLPKPIGSIGPKTPGMPETNGKSNPLTVRKQTARHTRHLSHRAHYAYHQPFDRPALAGVELLENLPHPLQPPNHIVVPLPAYPLENFAAFYTTPPPPVVCHPAPRDPDLPNPHLLYERPVICAADNP